MSINSDLRLLQRSQSLPEIVPDNHDSGVGLSAASGSCGDIDQIIVVNQKKNNAKRHKQVPYEARLVSELRQLMTLRQHYYPEGNYGWIIIVVGVAVQCICHGIHMSSGVFILEVSKMFSQKHISSGLIFFYNLNNFATNNSNKNELRIQNTHKFTNKK